MPQITESTPKATITIQGLEFAVSTPYTEGHQLTAAEASVINQTRCENIRNNFAGRVKAAKAEAATQRQIAEEDVTADMLPDFSAEFQALDQSYEFGVRRVGSGPALNPVDKEARKIARERLMAALKERNVDPKTLPEGALEKKIVEWMSAPEIQKEAQRRLKAVTSITLGELDFAAAA